MGTSLLLAIVVSIPLGLWAGLHKNKFVDKVIKTHPIFNMYFKEGRTIIYISKQI